MINGVLEEKWGGNMASGKEGTRGRWVHKASRLGYHSAVCNTAAHVSCVSGMETVDGVGSYFLFCFFLFLLGHRAIDHQNGRGRSKWVVLAFFSLFFAFFWRAIKN